MVASIHFLHSHFFEPKPHAAEYEWPCVPLNFFRPLTPRIDATTSSPFRKRNRLSLISFIKKGRSVQDMLKTGATWKTPLSTSIGVLFVQSLLHNLLLTKLEKLSAQYVTLLDFLTLSAKIQESESQKWNRASMLYSIIDSVQSCRRRVIFASNFYFYFLPQMHLYNSISNKSLPSCQIAFISSVLQI